MKKTKYDLPRLAKAIVLAMRDALKRNPDNFRIEVRKRIRSKNAQDYYLERLSDRRYYTAVKTNRAIISKYWQIS